MGSAEANTTVSVAAPNLDLARGLREVADWLVAHPELPKFGALLSRYAHGEAARGEMAAVARALDGATEQCEYGRVQIKGEIGEVRVLTNASVESLGGTAPVPGPAYEPIIPGAGR